MSFGEGLRQRRSAVLQDCVSCGACAEVCPMLAPAGLDGESPAALAGGILDWIREGDGPQAARDWAEACSSSGTCIPACTHGVNPRFMLALARLAVDEATSDRRSRRTAGNASYLAVARGSKILARLLLPPDLLARVEGSGAATADGVADGAEGGPEDGADILFYTGCNVLKTPHVVLICLDVLEMLGHRPAVRGGSGSCCGVLNFRAGDTGAAGRLGEAGLTRFAATRIDPVLAWCPTCHIQFTEHVLPNHAAATGETPFAMTPFVTWLADRLDSLRPLMIHPVRRRVALHEHAGLNGASEAARRLLEAIPELDFVDLHQPRYGYMCNSLNPLPAFKAQTHADLLADAERAGVDTLAGVFHACHRDLCSHERDWPFAVVNIMDLIGESMGLAHPDRFKALKMLQDVELVMAEVADLIDHHGLDVDTVRRVIARDMLGEQTLPLRGPGTGTGD